MFVKSKVNFQTKEFSVTMASLTCWQMQRVSAWAWEQSSLARAPHLLKRKLKLTIIVDQEFQQCVSFIVNTCNTYSQNKERQSLNLIYCMACSSATYLYMVCTRSDRILSTF